MEDCKEVVAPITINCLMDVDEVGQLVDSTKYRGLIGSLLYLTTSRQICSLVYAYVLGSKKIQRTCT